MQDEYIPKRIMKNRIELPGYTALALNALHSAGYEAYIVGGCVRDFIAGRKINDWDITTSALPEQTEAVFSAFRTVTDGKKHGTVSPIIDGHCVEITTFRVDGKYSDGRHPDDVRFTPSLYEDLARRDFTMNAIAYSPDTGFSDPFGGREDIENRIIRCVGDPEQRFGEDMLRILRAMRFASQTGFEVEASTLAAAKKCAAERSLTDMISAERIYGEIKKAVCGEYAAASLSLFYEVLTGMFEGVDKDNIRMLDSLPDDFPLRWALLFDCTDMAMDALAKLKADNGTSKAVAAIGKYGEYDFADRVSLKRVMREQGIENSKRMLLCLAAKGICPCSAAETLDDIVKSGECYMPKQLKISGNELVGLGYKGRKVGEALGYLLDCVIRGELENDAEKLKEAAKRSGENN